MNGDGSVVFLAGAAVVGVSIIGAGRFPDALPDWLGFLVLIVGAAMLLGQALGRIADEIGPPRGPDRFGRERDWAGLLTAIGAALGITVYLLVVVVVIVASQVGTIGV